MTINNKPMPRIRQPAVYIMTNKKNGTLYTGVTSHLQKRAYDHQQGTSKGFASRYHCRLLVWYEIYDRMEDAIAREKQLKAGSRAKKVALIQAMNPNWEDLYAELGFL